MRYQKSQRIALVPALIAMAILAVGTLPAQKAPQIPADLTKAASTGQLFANKTNGDIQDELTKAGFSLEQMNAALDQLGQQNEAAIQKATQNNTPAPAANSNNSAANPNQQSGTNVSLPPDSNATGSITVANHCPTAANFSVSLAPPQASSWISVPSSILSSGLNVGASGATSFNYQVSSNGMNPGSQIAGSIVVKCLNCTNCSQTGTNTFTVTLNVVSDTSSPGGGGGGGTPPGGGGGSNPNGGGSQPGNPTPPGGGTTGGTNPPGGGSGPNTGGPSTTSGPTSSFPQTGPGTQTGGTNPGNGGGPTTTGGGSNPSGGGPTTTDGGGTPPSGDTTVTGTTPTPTTTSTTNPTPPPTTTTGTSGFWSGLMGALTLALGGVGLLTGSGKPPQTTARPPATGTTPQTQTTPAPQTTGAWGVTGNAPTPATAEKAGSAPTGTPTTVGKDSTPTTQGQTTPTTPQTTSTTNTGDWGVTGSGPTPATGGLATAPGNTPQTVSKGGTPTTPGQTTSTTPQTTSTANTGDWGVTGSGPVPATGGLATAPGNTPQTVSKDPTPTTTGQPTSNTPQTTGGTAALGGAWGVTGTGPVAATGEKAGGPGQTVAKDGGNTPGTTEKTGGGGTPPTTSKDGDGTWGATGTGPTGSGPAGGTREKPAPGPGQTITKGPDTTDPPAPKPGDRNAGGGRTFSKGTTQADLEQANRPPTDDELKAAKPGDGPDDYATREKKLRLGMGMITINNESAPPIVARTDLPRTRVKLKPFVPTTQEDKDRLNYINTKLNDAITKAKSATDLATKAKNLKLARFWLYVRDHYGTLSKDFKNMLDDLQKTEGTYMYPEHEMLLQKYADEGAEAVNQYLRDSAEMEFYKGVGAIVDMGGNLGLGATFSAIESELAAISNEAQTGRSSSSSRATAEEEPTPSQHVEDDSNLPDFEKAPVDEEGGWGTRQPWEYEDDSAPILTDPKTGEAVPATIDPKTGDIVPVNGGAGTPASGPAPRTVSPDAPTVSVSETPTQVDPQFNPSKTQPDLLPHDTMPAKGMQKTAYDNFGKVPVDSSGKPGTRLPYSQGRFDPTDVPIDPQTGLPIPEK